MKIVIFGANGPTGQLLTKQALAEGHTVTAVTRHPATFPLQSPRLRVLRGDVFDLAAVEEAVAGHDAVLSTLGVPFSRKPVTVYSEGMTNIIQAMQKYGLRRLVCVTSTSLNPDTHPHGGFIFDKVMQPFFVNVVGKTVYADMAKMEKLVRESGLDWTIVRPSGLFVTPQVTDYRVEEAFIDGKFTSRTDLADCMLRSLTNDGYIQKVVAVATFSNQPSLFQLIWKEGIAKKA